MKFEILLPALFPLVGPGAITPMEYVPGVARSAFGIVACILVELTKVALGRFVALPLPFQVTLDPATNPEPVTVKGMSLGVPAFAPLGLIDVMEELTVGDAPR